MRKKPERAAIDGFAGHLMIAIARVVRERTREALQPLGLEPTLIGVLAVLVEQECASQRMLGRVLRADRTTMVRQIDELERKGLLERKLGRDRRVNELVLTQAGRALAKQVAPLVVDTQRDVLAALSEVEQHRLMLLLRRIYHSLPEDPGLE